MVKELTSEKQLKRRAISKAVASLLSRAGASNRHIGKSMNLTCKSKKVLDLLRSLRSGKRPAPDTGKLKERVAELEEYNQTLRKRVVDMQAQIYQLKSSSGSNPLDASLHEELQNLQSQNADLRLTISKLKEEMQSASKAVNIAWQQGYLAGQMAVQEQQTEKKGFIETLAEAAQAATAYGGEGAPGGTATATVTEQSTPVVQHHAVDVPDYLVGALQLDDPEVMNDPFTAKLLDALETDMDGSPAPQDDEARFEQTMEISDSPLAYSAQPDPMPQPVYQDPHANDPISQPVGSMTGTDFSSEPDGMEVEDTQHVNWYKTGNHEALAPQMAPQPSPQPAPQPAPQQQAEPPHMEEPQPQEPLPQEPAPQEIHAEAAPEEHPEGHENSEFSADELHNLFRNKYVREDEPQAKPERPTMPDPTQSGTFPSYKKFVGANKTQADPLPHAPRVFPPEIRKACKLLGLNPEEMTKATVSDAWKKEMAKPGVHPDTGGDTEMAIYLNTAKDTLVRWLDDQAPKLGKKFGAAAAGTRDHQKPKKE